MLKPSQAVGLLWYFYLLMGPATFFLFQLKTVVQLKRKNA
jgi:hypothetical protein